MRYTSKANQNRQYYVPREVGEMLGKEAEIIPNAGAVVFYRKGSPIRRILRSLAVIQLDLENELRNQEEEEAELEKEEKGS